MSKITLAPLPKWGVIFKSIFAKALKDKDLAKPWLLRESDIPYWFSRSAVSMHIIAKWWVAYTDKNKPTIWIPDYFCNEPLQLLTSTKSMG